MTGHDAVRRLEAFAAGKPLPRGETLRVPKPGSSVQLDDMFVTTFIRMGGESAPWGVAFGAPGRRPTVLSVPEPRTRDDVAAMMSEFAPHLLDHLLSPRFSSDTPRATHGGRTPEMPVRQVWLPNKAHLEMLHCVAYTYHRTRYGAAERQELLQALARACGWLFRESQRVGQTVTIVATQVLSEAFTFPADDIRQGHLGFLLAWLHTKGTRAVRGAAADAAEREAVSTSLDPELERTVLQPLVERYNQARSDDDQAAMTRAARQIRSALEPELLRRWTLTEAAVTALRDDKRRENRGVARLVRASQDEHFRQYLRIEQKFEDSEDGPPFTPSPETDRHPAAAGARYYVCASSEELRDRLLVHDDREMQAELIASGEALAGMIAAIEVERDGRKSRVFWTLQSDGTLPLRLREGQTLCEIGCDRRHIEILEITQVDAATNRFEVEVTKGKTLEEPPHLRRADDPRLRGSSVIFVAPPMDGISRRKSAAIWNADGPGAWLTHALPKGRGMELPDDVAEDLSEITARR
jgi:hypothetical protein